jgi:cellulose synthase/poly-beta-1,6-N-acetylglucosamine synthase-like glycosyltransferase
MTAITTVVVAVLGVTSVLLLAFGVNLLYLTWRATRLSPRRHEPARRGAEALVCVQIPVYNERYVAARVIDAVCALEWPASRLEVQVLDDSDDETAAIVDERVSRWRRRGLRVTHVRRQKRSGFKAGALAHGMALTDAPFIAIFDADFVPPADFLRRTMGVFADESIGFVQARWGHLDEGYSWFTRLQAIAIDFHFLVEQAVRSARGYFTNFTGTAGVWRRRAIEESGGWSAATLTEDLDLSYRAQLRGWKAAYLEDLVVPEELPVSIDAYRRQQSRWATGSFQGAFRLLVPVMRSRNRPVVKLQAAVHLLSYAVGPMMLLQLACYPWLVVGGGHLGRLWQIPAIAIWINLVGASPWLGFIVAQTRRGRPWWSGLPALLCQVVGAGMSLTVLLALLRALRGGGEFVRTPKYEIVRRGQEWRDRAYVRVGDPRAIGDAGAGAGALALVGPAIAAHQGLVAVYACVFALGFLTIATMTGVEFLEVMTLRNLGLRALARLRAAAPAIGLLVVATLLLLAAAQMPQPFEDGFGHWLVAANLAATGHLHDPLFGMEDTWLPGYSVVAAAVLRVFGLWQIDALRVLGAGFGVITLGLVYRLAANERQGRLAVALLALNPVFLFTASATVVEPLVTALLTGAALAATRARWRLAALLAALAVATSTKAWLFVATVAVVALVDWSRRVPSPFMGRVRVGGAVLAIPLLGLLALLPFAPNSLARGAQEVTSAIARGSVSGDPLARAGELVTTFGLAALPLVALGAIGLVLAFRHPDATLRFVHLPALAYLAAVVVLVAAGMYSGSHRYLYPALPSLALLAAAALDRQPAVARLAAAVGGGLLAIAFIPVFASFAASNDGLIAAGRAASGSPGTLVTDSPVAAYYSHKPPDQITGSQSMPLDRDGALQWIRARGVTELILENISYYHATEVFPELASGTATPPFEPLGDQAFYQSPGGKQVYVYRTGAALGQQSLVPGITVAIDPAPRQGKTALLAKGCTLIVGGFSAAGEGVGLGVPIVRYADGWVFPRTATTIDLSTGSQTRWQRIFELDETGGDALPGGGFGFAPIASRGQIAVTYTVDGSGVTIEVQPLELEPGYTQVGILNEESGAFDDFADSSRTLIGPAFGSWVPVSGDWARLRSGTLDVEWSLPAIPGAQLYGGREVIAPNFDWAGLDYIFNGPFTGARYHINVQEAK